MIFPVLIVFLVLSREIKEAKKIPQKITDKYKDLSYRENLNQKNHAQIVKMDKEENTEHDSTESELQETKAKLVELEKKIAILEERMPVKYPDVRFLSVTERRKRILVSLARRVGAKILIASTSEVYGDPMVHPQPESYWGNVNPIGKACYDEGKRVAETLAYSYAKQENVSVRVARIFNTYGPRMHVSDGRVVSNFIMQALQNLTIT
ncbi:Dtdp-glucose 4-6-dehydratase, partial [Operophtera brumata]